MHQMNHRLFAPMLAAVVVALMALCGAPAAHAQFPPTCTAADLTINNQTPCDIKLCLKGPNGVFCWLVPPSPPPTVVPFPPGFIPGGVGNTGNNTTYPFVPYPLVNGWWWVQNITLGLCCCDVFYDPASCTIWIRPTTAPPPCQ